METWEDFSQQQKLDYLSNKFGQTFKSIDANTCYTCEQKLSDGQRKKYTSILSSEIAIITYRGLSDEDLRKPSTADAYYWNMLSASPELKSRCLWHVAENYEP